VLGSPIMEPLTSFIDEMAKHLSGNAALKYIGDEFLLLSTIVHADTAYPSKVKHALDEIRKTSDAENCLGFVLLPSVQALATGKRILELAQESLDHRSESEAYLVKMQTVQEFLVSVVEEKDGDKFITDHMVKKIVDSFHTLEDRFQLFQSIVCVSGMCVYSKHIR
jgi:hypothetical protein